MIAVDIKGGGLRYAWNTGFRLPFGKKSGKAGKDYSSDAGSQSSISQNWDRISFRSKQYSILHS